MEEEKIIEEFKKYYHTIDPIFQDIWCIEDIIHDFFDDCGYQEDEKLFNLLLGSLK